MNIIILMLLHTETDEFTANIWKHRSGPCHKKQDSTDMPWLWWLKCNTKNTRNVKHTLEMFHNKNNNNIQLTPKAINICNIFFAINFVKMPKWGFRNLGWLYWRKVFVSDRYMYSDMQTHGLFVIFKIWLIIYKHKKIISISYEIYCATIDTSTKAMSGGHRVGGMVGRDLCESIRFIICNVVSMGRRSADNWTNRLRNATSSMGSNAIDVMWHACGYRAFVTNPIIWIKYMIFC